MTFAESSLLERAAGGDQDALEQLLQRDGPLVRGHLAGEIATRWQSVLSIDDVMQQTYIDAFLDVGRFEPRGDGSFAAWLTTLARRNLLDAIRMLDAEKRGGRHASGGPRSAEESLAVLSGMLGHAQSTPSRHAARNEARASLRKAIEQLPDTYRKVVQMYDLEGRPIEEVAEALKRRPGAVFMLRSRAHRYLRRTMGTASLYLSTG